jgi:hypothetical protein
MHKNLGTAWRWAGTFKPSCDKSGQYPLNRTGGEALRGLDASEHKQMSFPLCRAGHGQVTRLKLSTRERHEIFIKKNTHTHTNWWALHTLSCDKILWTYKEHYKTLFNKFFVRSTYNECIISMWYVRSSVTWTTRRDQVRYLYYKHETRKLPVELISTILHTA